MKSMQKEACLRQEISCGGLLVTQMVSWSARWSPSLTSSLWNHQTRPAWPTNTNSQPWVGFSRVVTVNLIGFVLWSISHTSSISFDRKDQINAELFADKPLAPAQWLNKCVLWLFDSSDNVMACHIFSSSAWRDDRRFNSRANPKRFRCFTLKTPAQLKEEVKTY